MNKLNIGFIGLGKMGSRLAGRLLNADFKLSLYDNDPERLSNISTNNAQTFTSLTSLINSIAAPRTIFLCIPAGKTVDKVIQEMLSVLAPNDTLIDLGNSYYQDSQRRAATLKKQRINYLDVGISGGIAGAENGACIMIGGENSVFLQHENLFQALSDGNSYQYLGKSGVGHLVKGYHNFVEYGYLQSLAEGLAALNKLSEQKDLNLNLEHICTLWNQGSIIESKLLDYAAIACADKTLLDQVEGRVFGQTITEMEQLRKLAESLGVTPFSCGGAIDARIHSQLKPNFMGKIINAMRFIFGGHQDCSKI